VTVTVLVTVAWLSGVSVHVSEYVIVTVGVTATEPDILSPVRSPTTEHEWAPVELQVSVAELPCAIV
jgi:hypothetical protein